MKTENIIQSKSLDFSLRIVRLYQHMTQNKKEFQLSKQIVRSGTSIGANIHEADQSYSKREFIHLMNISLKESVETEYWLKVLNRGEYINQEEFNSLYADCNELTKLLTAIIKTARNRLLVKASLAVYSATLCIVHSPLDISSKF